MVKLNFGEIECFYSDVYKKIACRIFYDSPLVIITGAEVPVDMLTYSINEIKSAMNRALQQGKMDLYNKYLQDLNAINQAVASPSPTPKTTMVPQKPSIVPVEEWKPQAYVSPPPPPTAPPPTQPAAPLPVQPQIQPQPPMEKKEEEEKRIDLKKLALLGLIGYLLMRKK